MENQLLQQIISERLLTITQTPEIKQVTGAKAINFSPCIAIVGNDAIERAAAHNGDIFSSLRYILNQLPEPRYLWLRRLAIIALYQISPSKRLIAKDLGIHAATVDDVVASMDLVDQIIAGNIEDVQERGKGRPRLPRIKEGTGESSDED